MIPRHAGRHAGTRRATTLATSASASAAQASLILTSPRITSAAPWHASFRPARSVSYLHRHSHSSVDPPAGPRSTGFESIYPAASLSPSPSPSTPSRPPMPKVRLPVYSHGPVQPPFTSFKRTPRSLAPPSLFTSSHARLTGGTSTTSMRLYNQQTQGQGRYIRIVEVSPRDGLQNLPGTLVPTETKRRLITKLLDAGVRTVEVGSFVRRDRVPQMADSAQLLPTLPRPDDVPPPRPPVASDALSGIPETSGRIPHEAGRAAYPVLIPNLKGFEALMKLEETEQAKQGQASGSSKRLTRDVAVFVSATEAFSKANNNASIDKVLRGIEDVVAKAKEHGLNVRGYVSCVMSDPYSGPTAPEEVVRVTRRLFDIGCDEVSLGDTTGEGNPTQWVKLWHALFDAGVDMDRIAAHCHDTFAMSLPSITALLPLGLRTIDTSVAGLGGCPYSPGATGNVPTEDVVYALHKLGYETGIDLEKLVDVGAWLSREVGVNNESRVGRAIYARKTARQSREATPPDSDAEKEQPKLASL